MIRPEILDSIRAELEFAGHGNKSGIISRYAGDIHVSPVTIWRSLAREFGKTRTIVREKRVSQDLVNMVADLKLKGEGLSLKARELSTEECIKILVERNIPGAEDLTPGTVNRRLAESGFRLRDPKVRIEAERANQEWQIDFSRSKYFQLTGFDAKRGDWILKVSNRELHYKADDKRMRTWITQVKDSYSRLRWCLPYAATGESGFIGLDAIHQILNADPAGPHLMRYVPERLKADNGAFKKSKFNRSAMKALNIDLTNTEPGEHDSQGKVESGFAKAWQQFELPLAVRMGKGATLYLSEYGELMYERMIAEHAEEHPRFIEKTKGAVYMESIQRHGMRETDVDVMAIACKVETRRVTQTLGVSWGGVMFEAPSFAQDKLVRVHQNMHGEVMAELVDEFHEPFVLKPPKEGENYNYRLIDDFEHRAHQTYRQQRKTAMAAAAENPDAAPYSEGNRVFMPVAAAKIKTAEVDSPFTARPAERTSIFTGRYEAKVYVGMKILEMTNRAENYEAYAEIFDPLIEETLDRDAIDEKLGDLRQVLREMNMKVQTQ